MRSTRDRVTISATVLALLCGAVLGLATFAGAAALWRAGQPHIGVLMSQSVLLAGFILVSGIALLAQPARLRRARVPVGRAVPHAWWPAPHDSLPALAACVGAPLFAGAGAAVLVFR